MSGIIPRDEGQEVQVVFLPNLLPSFEQWLDSRGLSLFRIPIDNPDDLSTYGIGISQALAMRRTGT